MQWLWQVARYGTAACANNTVGYGHVVNSQTLLVKRHVDFGIYGDWQTNTKSPTPLPYSIICSSAGSRAGGTAQDEPLKVADNTDGHETAPKTQLGGSTTSTINMVAARVAALWETTNNTNECPRHTSNVRRGLPYNPNDNARPMTSSSESEVQPQSNPNDSPRHTGMGSSTPA